MARPLCCEPRDKIAVNEHARAHGFRFEFNSGRFYVISLASQYHHLVGLWGKRKLAGVEQLQGFADLCATRLDARFLSAVNMVSSSIFHDPHAISHYEIKV